MNEELKSYAMRKVYFLVTVWIVILGVNTILMAIVFDCGAVNLSYFISYLTPFLIICYSILWWIGVNTGFEKLKKLQIMDDTEVGCSMRDWRK